MRVTLKDIVKEIKDHTYSNDIDIVFILGGDGTVNELINGVMKYDLDLPIGIIPGGTFNDFTKTLNLNPDFKKLVSNCYLHILSHMML